MYDLLIIGAGPAGMSAAVYAKRAGMHVAIVDRSPISGGQVMNTYEVDNYLGMPGISGMDMAVKFREHVDKLQVPVLVKDIERMEDKGNSKVVVCQDESLEARAVIVATGAQHAKLGVPGEEELSGMGVSYCATCDGAFFKGRTVAVVGGGDVALEDAIYLARGCEKVYLIHRRDAFRGAYVLQQELLNCPNVEILYSHVAEEICGEDMVTGLVVRDIKNQEKKTLELQGVFIAVGIHPQSELISDMVQCDEKGYVLADETCESSLPGLFVAGDIRKKPIRQVITAVADGANAVASVGNYLAKQQAEK